MNQIIYVPIVYRSMSKKDYAKRIGISGRTLRSWLNGEYYSELIKLGYSTLQKKLTARQVYFLDQKLVVTNDEDT